MSVSAQPVSLVRYISDTRVPLNKRIRVYLQTCRDPLFGKWCFDPWQIDDFFWALKDMKELMLLRNRGGSKTRDGSLLAVFFAYLKNHFDDWNRLIWFASAETQLEQASQYFRENAYVKKVVSDRIDLYNGNHIKFRVLTDKQSKSPRADVILFDEEQDMDQKFYMQALGAQIGGSGKRVHMGTTWLDTILHDNWKRLNKVGRVSTHTVDACSWTTREEAEEKYAGQPQWVIDSQLDCKWVASGGRVFKDVEMRPLTADETASINRHRYGGVDPNPSAGHAYVGVRDGGDFIYVGHEIDSSELMAEYKGSDRDKMDDSELFIMELFRLINNNYKIEVEENAGEEFIKRMNAVEGKKNAKFSIMRWNDKNKHKRIFAVRNHKIIVNPNCPNTYDHITAARWKEGISEAKLEKTSEQHFLDAFIHACQFAKSTAKSKAIDTSSVGFF